MSISKNNDYTTGNLLDYEYFSKHYELTAKDLSKKTELENPNLKRDKNFSSFSLSIYYTFSGCI